ncbi:MAG: hypothetical protein H6666_08975 [Ardenticatenaceae bacterium]|nr:hypothetical protein [Ardenticatenaceae bacterium]
MKTYKNLYPHIHTFANLYWAFRAARCGKRDRAAVASNVLKHVGRVAC